MIDQLKSTECASVGVAPASPATVHIVFGPSAAVQLRRALRSSKIPQRVISFPDGLATGPINPPDPSVRVDWLVANLGFRRKDWAWLPSRANAFWKSASLPGTRYVVWLSRRSVYEYTGFLEWVWRMGESPYEVIDLTDVQVDRATKSGRTTSQPALTLALMTYREIAAEKLWERSRVLSQSDRATYTEMWSTLRHENTAVRIIGQDGIKSASIAAFDQNLMASATPHWRTAIYLIGTVLAEGMVYIFQVGDHFLAARIVALIAAGKLEHRHASEFEPGQAGYFFGFDQFDTWSRGSLAGQIESAMGRCRVKTSVFAAIAKYYCPRPR